MKKLILTAVAMLATVVAYGQGQLVFGQAGAQLITNNVTGARAASGAAGTQVGLYIGTVGTAEGSLALITQTNLFIPGTFNGGVRTLTGWGAGPVTLQVRAWLASTVYSSYEAALAGGFGGDASVLLGVSGLFNHTLTTGTDTPQNISGNAGFNAIRIVPAPVPEPSSIALGLLGLGAVALFRRRK